MKINELIDHTLLKAVATSSEIEKLCEEAKKYQFKSVCVNPTNVAYAKKLLTNTNVLICTVIGFPLGANTMETKMVETLDAIKNGADEIDMVVNIGKVKEHDYRYIEEEIKIVVNAAQGRTVKVIIETCYLSEDEKIATCLAAVRAKANFVKTSTGFGTSGANISDVVVMKQTVGPDIGVKASGGVRSIKDVEAFVKAGATRIGTSSGVSLMNSQTSESNY